MKIVIDSENIIIYINKLLIDFNCQNKKEIEKSIKDIIIKIRKKYHMTISGYYKVNVYWNNNYGVIFEIIKLDDLDFFPDLIDLKVFIFSNCDIFLEIEDYFLISEQKKVYYYNDKYYVNIDDLDSKKIFNLSEYYNLIFGEKLLDLKHKFKKLLFDKNNKFC